MNVYTKQFIDDYQPYDELHTNIEAEQKKAELKQLGFQVIRTKWLSSLGYRQVRAIKYIHGAPNKEQLDFMKKWAHPC